MRVRSPFDGLDQMGYTPSYEGVATYDDPFLPGQTPSAFGALRSIDPLVGAPTDVPTIAPIAPRTQAAQPGMPPAAGLGAPVVQPIIMGGDLGASSASAVQPLLFEAQDASPVAPMQLPTMDSPSVQPFEPPRPETAGLDFDPSRATGEPSYQPTYKGKSVVKMMNSGATRSQDLRPELTDVLNQAAGGLGLRVEVFSGGQPSSGPKRVGTHGHDHGNAADIRLYRGDRRLVSTNKRDRELLSQFAVRAYRAGASKIGAGAGYMGGNIHVGINHKGKGLSGAPYWGAGGSRSKAAPWLVEAYNAAR